MPGFAHFIEGVAACDVARKGRVAAETLDRHGLADVLHDCQHHPQELVVVEGDGPDRRRGCILWPVPIHGDMPKRLGYDPDVQTWRPVWRGPDSTVPVPLRYTGWITDSPPNPTDIERRTRLSGWQILDDHNDQWLVPVARAVDNPRGNLPWEISWDDRDNWQIGVAGRYAGFWRDSARLDDLVRQHGRPDYQGHLVLNEALPDEDIRFALGMVEAALSLNYRVDRHVLAAYQQARPGFFSAAVVSLMANAIVDMVGKHIWDAAKKKTVTPPARGGTNSTPGSPAGTLDTSPAAANC